MKCKYCGAKGIKISHFMRKHKALMLRKMHRGRKGHRSHSGSRSGEKGHSSVHVPKGSSRVELTFYD